MNISKQEIIDYLQPDGTINRVIIKGNEKEASLRIIRGIKTPKDKEEK